MAEKDQKTEQPTQRRVQKAREEGDFPSARIFIGALQFLAFVAMLRSWGAAWIDGTHQALTQLLNHALSPTLDSSYLLRVSLDLVSKTFLPLAVLGGVLMGITLAAQLFVTQFGLSLKKLAPDPKRLNPLSRLREIPRQNLSALMQAMIMLPVFGWIYLRAGKDQFRRVPVAASKKRIGRRGPGRNLHPVVALEGVVSLCRVWCGRPFAAEAAVPERPPDEQAGNPRRNQGSGRQSYDEVANSTAAEGLGPPAHDARDSWRHGRHRESNSLCGRPQVQHGSAGAPKVVAKGKNYLALRIRQKAIDNQVPLIENPPLAQALYKSADVGQEIPAQFYRAVAEILAYIYRLMNGKVPA